MKSSDALFRVAYFYEYSQQFVKRGAFAARTQSQPVGNGIQGIDAVVKNKAFGDASDDNFVFEEKIFLIVFGGGGQIGKGVGLFFSIMAAGSEKFYAVVAEAVGCAQKKPVFRRNFTKTEFTHGVIDFLYVGGSRRRKCDAAGKRTEFLQRFFNHSKIYRQRME